MSCGERRSSRGLRSRDVMSGTLTYLPNLQRRDSTRDMKYFNMCLVRSPPPWLNIFSAFVIFLYSRRQHSWIYSNLLFARVYSEILIFHHENITIIWSASQLIVMNKWNMKIQVKVNLKELHTFKHKNVPITDKHAWIKLHYKYKNKL